MEESSTSSISTTKTRLVLKARTAFNSAASKAEKLLIDFKSDFQDSSEEQCRRKSCNSQTEIKGFSEPKQFQRKPPSIGKKEEWHERLRNIGRGRKRNEDLEKIESVKMFYYPIYDANLCFYNEKVASEAKGLEISDCYDAINRDIIPPASVFKQLTVAIESEKNYTSVKHFLSSSASSSPVRERASMGISAVKSLVLQEKAEKVASEFRDDDAWAFIQSILDTEGLTLGRKVGFSVENLSSTMTLPRDIRGAPPQSLIVKISEVMGSFKTLRKMALFWCRFIAELRRLWLKEEYIPGIPLDEIPDLSYCLLYQQLQLINCCLSRKKRRAIATDSLESLIKEADCDADGVPSSFERITSGSFPYAKTSNGNLVVRLGISHQSDDLTLLETGEPVYAPLAQEGPLLTEDLARETEEFVLRTGSVGAGCSQLLSDMQAFKAANPGCILEDFVRWHSPPDWTENESGSDSDASAGAGDSTSSRGRLSRRMKKEGNLWLELWETAKPVPAVRQAPLFDEDLAVEGALAVLEDISPSQLFRQLFQSLLGLGFVIAEDKLSSDENVTKLFYECKDFVVVSCQGDAWTEKFDDICQVYETVEAMFVRSEDVIKAVQQPEDACVTLEEPTSRFKKISQVFGGKNRARKSSEDNDSTENTANHRQSFATFFDSRASMFGKKPPKPANGQYQASHPGLDENHWTVV